jgi:hypothetical protein
LAKHIFLLAFAVTIGTGGWALSDYSYRPGESGNAVANLNSLANELELFRNEHETNLELPTLILFFHPHCPCTNSTIRNLERLSVQLSKRANIVAFGFCPKLENDSWIESPITSALKRLEANVVVDKDGQHCSKFGAFTSGHVLLYGHNGELLFTGGITAGRGHEGDCAATWDLLQKVDGLSTSISRWPVYGCPILRNEEQ